MKTLRLIAVLACLAASGYAKPIPGPKGGRILNAAAPYAEFYVEKDHSATVTFYDANMKPLAPGEQVVTAVTEAWLKTTIAFAKTSTGFASQGKLPHGDDYKITVRIKDSSGAPARGYRFYYEDEVCSTCHREKYACICDDAK